MKLLPIRHSHAFAYWHREPGRCITVAVAWRYVDSVHIALVYELCLN